MKKFKLKKVAMLRYSAAGRKPMQPQNNEKNEPVELSYREALMEKLCIQNQAGVPVDYLEKAIPILDKLQAAKDGDVISLTDEEHTFILDRFKGYPLVSPTFLRFHEDLKKAAAE